MEVIKTILPRRCSLFSRRHCDASFSEATRRFNKQQTFDRTLGVPAYFFQFVKKYQDDTRIFPSMDTYFNMYCNSPIMTAKLITYLLKRATYEVIAEPKIEPYDVEAECSNNSSVLDHHISNLVKERFTYIGKVKLTTIMTKKGVTVTTGTPVRPPPLYDPSYELIQDLTRYIKDLTREGIEPNPGPRRNVSKNTQKQKRQPKKGNKNNKSHFPLHVIQPRQTVQMNSCIRDLCFELSPSNFNNPGGPVVQENFYLNDLYDVLPTILTPTVQFLNYMFTLYKFGKVLSVEVVHTFNNLENNALSVYYFSSAQSLAASFSSKDAVVALAATAKLRWKDTCTEQYGKRSQIIMRKVLVPWMSLGNQLEYMSSNDFSFTQSTNPARFIHGAWVIIGPQSTISSGITVTTTLNFRVKFYDALDLVTPVFQAIPEPTPVPAVVPRRRA